MDQDSPAPQEMIEEQIGSDVQRERSSQQNDSRVKQGQQNKVVRRPGRPPLKIKNRQKNIIRSMDNDNQNDEYIEIQRSRLKEKNYFVREERQNSIQGFIKIIDYLKKIQCDQMSLHNKMNPYNLLTPTCYWYMISAEYFSFDFFNNKNPQQTALEFLKKAQKTQIILPLRVLKPLKTNIQLQFETPQLRQLSIPITEKLTNLTQLILAPCQTSPESIEKSNHLTTIVQDNQFRSSTRAMIFNWIKKKIGSSEKWSSALKPKLQPVCKIIPKQFTSKVYQYPEEKKHEQLDIAPQIYYRQRRIIKNPLQIKRNRQIRRKPQKEKLNLKKQKQDQIFDQSESEEIKKQPEEEQEQRNEQIAQNEVQSQNQMIQERNQEQIKAQAVKYEEEIEVEKKQENQININYDPSQDEENINENKPNDFLKFNKIYNQDDLLLDSILHLPLDNIISILKASIETPRPHEIQRPYLPIPKNDPLELVYQIHPDEEIFLNYMKQRQEKMYEDKSSHSELMIEEKQRQGQVEDAKCQVCTDGDYTQDNLIVFCSMCNISLHQRCVGLAKVPADNWICQVCASFGPAGINVPCPLCHVKGGALKRTSIHINTPLFKDTNPEYHEFTKKCPNYKHKEQYPHPLRTGVKGEEEPYYDYFLKTTYPADQPICHFVWVHYVCAIWVPQCYFEQKNGLINIKGIQNIDKRRFRQRCLICKESKAGACVKCENENCTKFYHPQCARKKRIYMEQLNLDKLKYLIFCQAHEPLKVKRKIEVKKKKHRDEIVKFCRGIQKYVETYKIANLSFKLPKLGVNNCSQMLKLDSKKEKIQQGDLKIMIKVEKRTDEDFIKSVIDGLIKQNQIIVNLTNLGNDRYKIDEIIKPSKRDMRKSLTRQDQFWKNFQNNQTPESNLKRFNAILRQNNYLKEKIQNFINFGNSSQDKPIKDEKKNLRRNVGRRKKQPIQTVIEQQGAIFCVCRKPYDGQDDMFQCQVCNQWYHHSCIGFVGSEQDAQKLVFHCMKCLKYESPEAKKILLDKCGHFFSEDSLYLNYRPPTPSLQSDDEQIQLNYPKNQIAHINQSKQYTPKQKSERQRRKNHSSYIIQDEKINFQVPFIIFETNEKKQQKKYAGGENENKELKNENQPDLPQEQMAQSNQQEVSLNSMKNTINKIEQNLNKSEEMQQVSIVARAYSSQSSQLLTPEFRPSVMSFGPIVEEAQQVKVNEKQEHIKVDENKNEQNKDIKDHIDLHFNRSQIEKVKNQLEQRERQIREKNKGESLQIQKNQ